MPCYSPLTGYYSRERTAKGKRGIVFSLGASHSGVPVRLPCGQCVGCRLEHSRQWAMRCMNEKQLHASSCFVTVTYEDANLPPGSSLRRRDFQLFMKRLRKARGKGLRFYGCGEYGETTNRPHYHAILFNCHFPDQKIYKKGRDGHDLYRSDELDRIWGLGLCTIGDVTFDSAAYVARYIMKKITGDLAVSHYTHVDQWGEVHDMVPEFQMMSRRPGIGKAWFDKFGKQSYKHDSVIMNGMEVRPPRYYDGLYEHVDSAHLEKVKKKRRNKALRGLSDNTPERRRVREIVATARLGLKGRSI